MFWPRESWTIPDLATGFETGPCLRFPPHLLPNLLLQSPFFKHLNGEKVCLLWKALSLAWTKMCFGSIKRDIRYPLGALPRRPNVFDSWTIGRRRPKRCVSSVWRRRSEPVSCSKATSLELAAHRTARHAVNSAVSKLNTVGVQ